MGKYTYIISILLLYPIVSMAVINLKVTNGCSDGIVTFSENQVGPKPNTKLSDSKKRNLDKKIYREVVKNAVEVTSGEEKNIRFTPKHGSIADAIVSISGTKTFKLNDGKKYHINCQLNKLKQCQCKLDP